jgi:hypothetical protein
LRTPSPVSIIAYLWAYSYTIPTYRGTLWFCTYSSTTNIANINNTAEWTPWFMTIITLFCTYFNIITTSSKTRWLRS